MSKVAPLNITASEKGGKAVIKIKGYITDYQNTSQQFEEQVDKLKDAGHKNALVYVDSGGGSVFQALEIVNVLDRFEGTVTTVAGALCASAATIIHSKGDVRKVYKNTGYMIHRPMGIQAGNADDFLSYAQLLQNIEATGKEMYAAISTFSESQIEKKWQSDWWLTAKQLKEYGFATEIIDEDTTADDSTKQMYKAYQEYGELPVQCASFINDNSNPNNNSNNPKNKRMEELFNIFKALMGLDAEAPSDQVINKLNELKAKADKADELQAKLEKYEGESNEDKIKNFLDTAQKDKRINAEQRTQLEEKAEQLGYDGLVSMVDMIKPAQTISNNLDTEDPNAEEANWSWDDYEKNGKTKELMEKREKDPEAFKKLYQAKFKREWKPIRG